MRYGRSKYICIFGDPPFIRFPVVPSRPLSWHPISCCYLHGSDERTYGRVGWSVWSSTWSQALFDRACYSPVCPMVRGLLEMQHRLRTIQALLCPCKCPLLTDSEKVWPKWKGKSLLDLYLGGNAPLHDACFIPFFPFPALLCSCPALTCLD